MLHSVIPPPDVTKSFIFYTLYIKPKVFTTSSTPVSIYRQVTKMALLIVEKKQKSVLRFPRELFCHLRN